MISRCGSSSFFEGYTRAPARYSIRDYRESQVDDVDLCTTVLGDTKEWSRRVRQSITALRLKLAGLVTMEPPLSSLGFIARVPRQWERLQITITEFNEILL